MSYTDEDVERVANAYHWEARNSCGPDDCPGVPECIYAEHLDWDAFRASVRALSEAGRLLPLEAETEWSVRFADGYVIQKRFTEEGARAAAEDHAVTLVMRKVGPWIEVTDGD